MPRNIPSNVDAAFEILLEEIEEIVGAYIRENASACQARDFQTARKMIERAEMVTTFRQKVDAVRREWSTLERLPHEPRPPRPPTPTQPNRLPRGVRTREEAFYVPILESLIELGGSAPVADVLEKVGSRMKGILRDVDYQMLPSDPDEPRWRNTAKWARNSLVQDGRLKSGSRFGVWEITQAGREWVANKPLESMNVAGDECAVD